MGGGDNLYNLFVCLQMLIALGTCPDTFGLPPLLHFSFLVLFWLLLHIHASLWDGERSSEPVLRVVHRKIQCMMKLFRKRFWRIDKVQCRNTKYHDNIHLVDTMLELASLRLSFTGPGEQKNKFVKANFKRTNRKRKRLEQRKR